MLIPSTRYTPRDLDTWRRLERQDAVHARTREHARRVDEAMRVLADFAAAGPCWIGTSWGKDSTVLAHLGRRVELDGGPRIPVVWFPAVPCANPDSALVRDAFLAAHPVEYVEIPSPHIHVGDGIWQVEKLPTPWDVWHIDHPRHVLGLRAQENRTRRLRMECWGHSTRNTCAPLGYWSDADVFAYLHAHRLPVHPTYACLGGGTYNRGRLRVDDLGGEEGRIFTRAEWERRYYRDAILRLEQLAQAAEQTPTAPTRPSAQPRPTP